MPGASKKIASHPRSLALSDTSLSPAVLSMIATSTKGQSGGFNVNTSSASRGRGARAWGGVRSGVTYDELHPAMTKASPTTPIWVREAATTLKDIMSQINGAGPRH
jgi:hypothetical protein